MRSRVVVVSGACGAGKSTALRALMRLRDDVAVLEPDHFYIMIDPEWKVPWPDAEKYWDIGMSMLHRTIAGFVERDVELIGVPTNAVQQSFLARKFARSLPDGVPLHHVTLDP